MKRHIVQSLGVIVACTLTPALADVGVGDKAPEISAIEWFNLPKGVKALKPSHLNGQIVMLEFWGTWCGPCIRSIPHLVEMREKYKSRGVVLVALSDEPESKVKPCVKRNKMTYIVGCGARATQRTYGISSFPTMFLIDPAGKVAWKGHPAVVEPALEELLKDKPPRRKGFLAERWAKDAYRTASRLYDQRRYAEALRAFEGVTKYYGGTKDARRAKKQIKKMKANSRIMEIIAKAKAEKVSKGWIEVARMLAQYGDKKDALKYYKRIMKKHPDTKYAKLARAEMKLLEESD